MQHSLGSPLSGRNKNSKKKIKKEYTQPMCGLPSSTPGAALFSRGISGQIREKVFGRGTNDRILSTLDKVHRKTVGKVVGQGTVDRATLFNRNLQGSLPFGQNPDYEAERRKKKFASEEAERNRIYRSLGQTNAPPSILGG